MPPVSPAALRGFYAITSETICADGMRLVTAVEAAVLGGARLIQYRDKRSGEDLRRRQARLLAALCHRLGARLIVNDDPWLAAEAGADGVHLGRKDAAIREARALLGPQAIIGASCGPSLERARAAEIAGASYLAFGRFFPSRTKPDAPQAQLRTLQTARRLFDLPLCVIGGVTPHNAAPLIEAGADLVAAVEGVFGANDVRLAATDYSQLFK